MDTIDEENETDKDDDGGRETGVRLVSQEGKIISPSSVREEPTEDTTDQPRSSTNTSSRVIPKPAMLLVGQGSSRTPRTRDRTSQQNGRQESSGPRMTTSKNTHTTSTPCSCSRTFMCYVYLILPCIVNQNNFSLPVLLVYIYCWLVQCTQPHPGRLLVHIRRKVAKSCATSVTRGPSGMCLWIWPKRGRLWKSENTTMYTVPPTKSLCS